MSYIEPDTRRTVLRTATATEAAETGRWHSEQGDYRAAAVWHQLAAAIEATDRREPARGPKVVAVPLVRPPMLAERPRTFTSVDLRHPEPCGYPDMQPCICRPSNGEPSPAPMPDQQVGVADLGLGPTGNGDRDLADTASIPLPESHAPTTCVALVAGGAAPYVCGELIVWRPGQVGDAAQPARQAGWVHASDDRLGVMPHPATPQGPGPLPKRAPQ